MAEHGDISNAEGVEKIDLLLEKSHAKRYRDPQEMVRLAELARDEAERLGASRPAADLRCRVFAEVANAYRLSDRLDLAEQAMQRALGSFEAGSKSSGLLALLADRLSSLLCHRRRFPEALELLDILGELYRSSGEEHLAGRALILRGLYTEYSGDPERALDLTLEALALIDREKDPALLLAAVHNLLWCATEMGLFAAVRRLLPGVRPLYGEGDRLSRLRLSWVEARVAAGLGEGGEAERIFQEVRGGFLGEGLLFPGSLVSLDLALLLLAQGRVAEIGELAAELILSFRTLGVGREALASLVLLRRAAEGAWRSETAEMLRERILAARETVGAVTVSGALS